MTNRDLEELVQALTDGSLGQDDFERLQDELRTNAGSREFFRQSMEVEMLLVEAMGQRDAIGGARDRMEAFLHRRRRREMTRALLATAALLMVAALVMTLVIIRQPETATLVCTPVPGTQWGVEGESNDHAADERQVVEGSTVRVLSGTVRLELESGTVMVMRGPAEAAFPKLDHPVLRYGWLWIDSGGTVDAFAVETPEIIVRDIGTRFGVRVRGDGQAEVHLVDGRVEVFPKNGGGEILALEPVGKGFFLPASGRPAELPLEPDPFPGLPDLLATAPDYRTTVLSQGPVGYWRLDETAGDRLDNEIPEGASGEADEEVVAGAAGVRGDEGFKGFSQDNSSTHLTGHLHKSLLRNLDAPGGVSKEEGAVTFWIRRNPGIRREEILWLAGRTPVDGALNPRESMMHTRLSAAGRIEFVIENGEFDVLLSSNFSVADGRWHHVAASWGPSAVELHVDGRRVARADDFGQLQQGIMRGRYVRFGKPSDDLMDEGKAPFTGWVDEIALWSRPLSGFEIAHQVEAARGAAVAPREREVGKPSGEDAELE